MPISVVNVEFSTSLELPVVGKLNVGVPASSSTMETPRTLFEDSIGSDTTFKQPTASKSVLPGSLTLTMSMVNNLTLLGVHA